MSKIPIKINIDEELYKASKDKLNMSLDEFVDYSLTMFIHQEDEYSRLFQKGAKLQSELNKLQKRMLELEVRNDENKNNQEYYDKAMITVNRIHNELGYIGKNQLKKIANNNNLNHIDLIHYVERLDDYNITNFGDLPK